jgi:hypothetical protein
MAETENYPKKRSTSSQKPAIKKRVLKTKGKLKKEISWLETSSLD